jgi:predicted hotdog family 3-hydroxylacyl-ACP dehydratase
MSEALNTLAVDDLVPHRGDMRWLDTVVSANHDAVVAESTIRPDSFFVRDGALPVWVGVEFMAQAVAIWAGHRGLQHGRAARIGLLLGTRRYDVYRQAFRVGDRLRIEARCEFMGDNGLGRILVDDDVVAQANLSVFEPPDEAAFLNSSEVSA